VNNETKTFGRVGIPEGSLIADVPFTDHADAFRGTVDATRFPDVDSVARAFVAMSPRWVAILMRLRDSAVGIFGLKRSVDAPPSAPEGKHLAPGDLLGFFRVMERNDAEIVVGEDDRHLDFRVSFLHEGSSVVVTTVVKFHNAWGRMYFLPVAPFHRLIVPAMLRSVG
jgi:hypothetical protein